MRLNQTGTSKPCDICLPDGQRAVVTDIGEGMPVAAHHSNAGLRWGGVWLKYNTKTPFCDVIVWTFSKNGLSSLPHHTIHYITTTPHHIIAYNTSVNIFLGSFYKSRIYVNTNYFEQKTEFPWTKICLPKNLLNQIIFGLAYVPFVTEDSQIVFHLRKKFWFSFVYSVEKIKDRWQNQAYTRREDEPHSSW